MPMRSGRVELKDGRVLAYDEHGTGDGVPLFYFHGAPSARNEVHFFDLPAVAERLRIRLIAPDRPGLGLSTFQPKRRVSDWPADVASLADHLGVPTFAVVGYSGGGPYALACAARIPERLTAVGLVSSSVPHTIPGVAEGVNPNSLRFMRLSVEKPWLSRLLATAMGLLARYQSRRLIASALESLPEPDRHFMTQDNRGSLFAGLVSESVRHGGRGAQLDTALMLLPWDFDPREISMTVDLWHGEEDWNAPLAMGRYLAGALPNVLPRFLAGEGHLSLLGNHAKEILATIIRASD